MRDDPDLGIVERKEREREKRGEGRGTGNLVIWNLTLGSPNHSGSNNMSMT
jgi:hypothetical protein